MSTHADRLRGTLGSAHWIRDNERAIKALLPQVWTHMENIAPLRVGFGFKLLGIEWSNSDEFATIMLFLEKAGILQRQNLYAVRANPGSIFQTSGAQG